MPYVTVYVMTCEADPPQYFKTRKEAQDTADWYEQYYSAEGGADSRVTSRRIKYDTVQDLVIKILNNPFDWY